MDMERAIAAATEAPIIYDARAYANADLAIDGERCFATRLTRRTLQSFLAVSPRIEPDEDIKSCHDRLLAIPDVPPGNAAVVPRRFPRPRLGARNVPALRDYSPPTVSDHRNHLAAPIHRPLERFADFDVARSHLPRPESVQSCRLDGGSHRTAFQHVFVPSDIRPPASTSFTISALHIFSRSCDMIENMSTANRRRHADDFAGRRYCFSVFNMATLRAAIQHAMSCQLSERPYLAHVSTLPPHPLVRPGH